jgi:tight adherence protein C
MQDPLVLAICVFLTLLVVCGWLGYRYAYRPGRVLKQLGAPVITGASSGQIITNLTEPAESSAAATVLRKLGAAMPSSEAEMAGLKVDLVQAGYRNENAMAVFYGVRILATLLMLVVALALQTKAPPNPALRMAVLGFGTAAGWILPRMFLEKRVAKRQEILRLALPDALDLLVVSIEAGLGLDQAISHVARELETSHPELSEDLTTLILEMRAGKRRADALRNFGERTGDVEIKRLVAILIQNDRFGTSMGESLRNHSDYMRIARRQLAEERAGKVGVKLVFPIFFFILPSMVIVAAGPGILQLFKNLFPMMKQVS